MGASIVKQPNGKYARFSTYTDTITHINMTKEDYIKVRIKEAIEIATEQAKIDLKYYVKDFKELETRSFLMAERQFKDLKPKMEDPDGKYERIE